MTTPQWSGRRWEVKERRGSMITIHPFGTEEEAQAFADEIDGVTSEDAEGLAEEVKTDKDTEENLDETPDGVIEFSRSSSGLRAVLTFVNPTDEEVVFWRSVGKGSKLVEIEPGDTSVRSYVIAEDLDAVEIRLIDEDGPVVQRAEVPDDVPEEED